MAGHDTFAFPGPVAADLGFELIDTDFVFAGSDVPIENAVSAGEWGGIPSLRSGHTHDPALKRTPIFLRGEKPMRAFIWVIS